MLDASARTHRPSSSLPSHPAAPRRSRHQQPPSSLAGYRLRCMCVCAHARALLSLDSSKPVSRKRER